MILDRQESGDHAVRPGELGEGDRCEGAAYSEPGERSQTGWTADRAGRGRLTNYRSPSFNPKTGLFVVSAHTSYGIYFNKPADGAFGWPARIRVWGKGVLEAIDYRTGKVTWTHELGSGGSGAGVLTTESGLTFTGDAQGSVLALRTSDGKTLWHAGMGQGMQSSPVTYELDGRQFVLSSGGSVMFAWALPEE